MKPVRDDLMNELGRELCASCRSVSSEITPDAHFRNDLGLDSLDLVEFIARIEAKYRVPVPDGEWEQLASINKVADYVLERL